MNYKKIYILIVLLYGSIVHAYGQISQMSINVGFDAQGKPMTTEGAALTVWGKTVIHNSTDHIHDIDLSVFPVVEDFILWTETDIVTKDYRLIDIEQWADYVFDEGYELMPLSEVEAFVGQNHHLPGVRSAIDLGRQVYTLKEMNKDFISKIEELTLHVINQEESIEKVKKRMKRDSDNFESLLNQFGELEKKLQGITSKQRKK